MESVPQRDGHDREGDALAVDVRASAWKSRQTSAISARDIAQASLRATHGVEQRGPPRREVAGHDADEAQQERWW